jgi:hypothetical protein
MKKNLFGGLISVILFGAVLFLPKTVSANEGVINLRGTTSKGSCYAASVFVDGTYKILMTCRDLKIALTSEKNIYVAWVEDEDGKQKRLGEIVNGKMSTLTDIKYVRILVTAETSGYGNKPSEDVILTGAIEPINFGPGIVSTPIITPTPTPTRVMDKTVSTVGTGTQESNQSGLGTALSTVFKIALLGFGVLLLVVGVFSFLSRRRSL